MIFLHWRGYYIMSLRKRPWHQRYQYIISTRLIALVYVYTLFMIYMMWPSPNKGYGGCHLLRIWEKVRRDCANTENPLKLVGHSTDSAWFLLSALVMLMIQQRKLWLIESFIWDCAFLMRGILHHISGHFLVSRTLTMTTCEEHFCAISNMRRMS